MTMEPKLLLRLQFLVRVVRKECKHLSTIDQRLFTLEQATRLEEDPDLAERVEAFVGRFGRLQDTVGDKLLPLPLTALQTGHAFVQKLIGAANKMIAEIARRGWA